MSRIKVTRGSDASFQFLFRDSAGVVLPLVSAELFDVSRDLEGRLSITPVDFAQGNFVVNLEGTDPIPTGRHTFRCLGTKPDGDTIGSPEVAINVV